MKKSIISALALILMLTYSNGSSAKDFTGFLTEIKRTIVIKIEIELGGRNTNCAGKGICKIDVDVNTGGIVGTIDYNSDKGNLFLSFSKEDVSTYQSDKLQYLAGNQFVLPTDYVFPAALNSKLGASSGIVLKAGSYPLTFKNGTYTILFDKL